MKKVHFNILGRYEKLELDSSNKLIFSELLADISKIPSILKYELFNLRKGLLWRTEYPTLVVSIKHDSERSTALQTILGVVEPFLADKDIIVDIIIIALDNQRDINLYKKFNHGTNQ